MVRYFNTLKMLLCNCNSRGEKGASCAQKGRGCSYRGLDAEAESHPPKVGL